MAKQNLRARRRAKRTRLLDNHRVARYQWAQERVNWHQQWQNCMFSDETRFNLDHYDGRILVWRQAGERYDEENMAPQEAFGLGLCTMAKLNFLF